MSSDVAAEAYDSFMGRYSRLLSGQLADFAAVARGQRVLDVGCGPGALTEELVARLGAAHVTAVDPSAPFVEAARARHPGVRVEQAAAEQLPFDDHAFDAALAQLVVHFMRDPVGGLAEMARVTRPGGIVAATVWDHAGGKGPLVLFWQAARDIVSEVEDQSRLPGTREGHLAELMAEAGLRDIESTVHVAHLEHASFEEWWAPFERGFGPAGALVARLEPDRREALRERCRQLIPAPPIVVRATAWAARGFV